MAGDQEKDETIKVKEAKEDVGEIKKLQDPLNTLFKRLENKWPGMTQQTRIHSMDKSDFDHFQGLYDKAKYTTYKHVNAVLLEASFIFSYPRIKNSRNPVIPWI